MREIQASEAQGETPITTSPQQELDDAIEGIMNLRKQNGKITLEELRCPPHHLCRCSVVGKVGGMCVQDVRHISTCGIPRGQSGQNGSTSASDKYCCAKIES